MQNPGILKRYYADAIDYRIFQLNEIDKIGHIAGYFGQLCGSVSILAVCERSIRLDRVPAGCAFQPRGGSGRVE